MSFYESNIINYYASGERNKNTGAEIWLLSLYWAASAAAWIDIREGIPRCIFSSPVEQHPYPNTHAREGTGLGLPSSFESQPKGPRWVGAHVAELA